MTDLDHWANELAGKLAGVSIDYVKQRSLADGLVPNPEREDADPDFARIAATALANQALVQIVLALNKLPQFNGAFTDGPMPDLISAMEDLRLGRSPDFFKPAQGMNGQLSTKLDMLKLRAVASVLLLKRTGFSDAEARRQIARTFSAAGHKGKKRGALSARTVFDWCTECAPDLAGSTHQRLIADMLAAVPETVSRERALDLVRAEARKRT